MNDIYTLVASENPLPIIYDSPHSGTRYPRDFYYACPFAALERAEDKYVDDLFAAAPHYGGTLIAAQFPRTYIDVNRAQDDIDPELMEEPWPGDAEPSSRAHAGIGLIRRLVKPGVPIYERSLSVSEVQGRITRFYHPYHAALEQAIGQAHYTFGTSWHINCHSMPAQGGALSTPVRAIPFRQPDIVLGDRDGTTCEKEFTHALRDFLKKQGYRVAINDPYKGVECIRRHADPARGRHSIQIEICKTLYMDEVTCEKNSNYNALKADIEKLMERVAEYARAALIPLAAD